MLNTATVCPTTLSAKPFRSSTMLLPFNLQSNLVATALVLLSLFSASSLAISPSPSPTTVISTGLRNLGNTCYLNAQLQCAFHIPKVRDTILSPPAPAYVEEDNKEDANGNEPSEEASSTSDSDDVQDEEKKEDDSDENKANQPVIVEESQGLLALRHVFNDMLQSFTGELGPISPRVLTSTLGIPVLEQQDSQEFWKLLLPALDKTALSKLYTGKVEDYIVALDGSKRERRREEVFLDLSLDVSPDGRSSVSSSLERMFGQPELLSVAEGVGWRPEKGAEKVDAHKGIEIRESGLPAILQLHLKRFNYDWTRDVMEKVNDPVEFPLVLNMSSILVDTPQQGESSDLVVYDLQSVLIHMGEFGVGHYYSYVRPNIKTDAWYRFNDDIVSPVSFDEVLADAVGGKINGKLSKKRGLLGRIKSIFEPPSFGYGGRTSNAYVLQYVRRSEIPTLYDGE